MLYGLELIARHRDISLSQAVEYAYNLAAREYVVDEELLRSWVETAAALENPAQGLVRLDAHDGIERSPAEMDRLASAFFTATGLSRILSMPQSLLKADERYALQMFNTEGPGYWTEGLEFARLAREGFEQGVPPHEMAERWRREAVARIGGGVGKAVGLPKARSSKK